MLAPAVLLDVDNAMTVYYSAEGVCFVTQRLVAPLFGHDCCSFVLSFLRPAIQFVNVRSVPSIC